MGSEMKSKGMPQPRFAIGQKLWIAHTHTRQVQLPCPDCHDSKKWPITSPAGDAFEIACPRCAYSHSGRTRDVLGSLVYSEYAPYARELTVGSVRIDTHDENPIHYMCVETGVGSGTLYREKECFGTEPEALAYGQKLADQQNAQPRNALNKLDAKLGSHVTAENALALRFASKLWDAYYVARTNREALMEAVSDFGKDRLQELEWTLERAAEDKSPIAAVMAAASAVVGGGDLAELISAMDAFDAHIASIRQDTRKALKGEEIGA